MQGAQLVAHGRVNAGVAAGHTVARFPGQGGHATHEGAANAEDVNVHIESVSRRRIENARFYPTGCVSYWRLQQTYWHHFWHECDAPASRTTRPTE